jgi:Flp pilus assembly protein TadD
MEETLPAAPTGPAESSELTRVGSMLQRGEYQEAAAACRAMLAAVPDDAPATHMLGLSLARLRQPGDAEPLLRRSLELEPGNAGFRINFANFLRRHGRLPEAEREYRAGLELMPEARLARQNLALTLDELGRRAEAETECRGLLATDGRDAEAWSVLGYLLTNQGRLFEAEAAYRRALDLNPGSGLAHQNLGSLLLETDRAEEAMQALSRAHALGTPPFELLFARGRALTLLYRLEEAEQAFSRAVEARPRHILAQTNLARLRFMRADPDFTRGVAAAIAAAPRNLELLALLGTLLLRAGRFEQAESQLRGVLHTHGPLPQFRGLLARVLLEAGRLEEAEREALEAAGSQPRNTELVDTLVAILLARGRARDALPFIETQRAREPEAQGWIAHQASAARLLGQPLYRDLYDYGRFVRAATPEAPPGWSSMRELNEAVLAALTARHRVAAHPLDQSLRNGSQTTRNLVADPDPAIAAILKSFEDPIRRYLRDIGADAAHPFTARARRGARIDAGWSVQLRQGGFHVNHIHPKGWISSTYYVAVPEEADDVARKSGWLKFGEPRYPVPGATPDQYVQPKPGLLVLFPSYIWHGTTPIHGAATRTTIAFDALPSA